MMVPTKSDAPPAAKGDTIRTARVGQSCAPADAQSVSNAQSDAAINPPARIIGSPSALRDLGGVDLEHLVETPARDLTAGRKPDAVGILHVLDDRPHRAGATGPARNIRMELERHVGRGEL